MLAEAAWPDHVAKQLPITVDESDQPCHSPGPSQRWNALPCLRAAGVQRSQLAERPVGRNTTAHGGRTVDHEPDPAALADRRGQRPTRLALRSDDASVQRR